MENNNTEVSRDIIRQTALKCGIPILFILGLCIIASCFQDAARNCIFAVLNFIFVCLAAIFGGVCWAVSLINYGDYLSDALSAMFVFISQLPSLAIISVVLCFFWLLCIRHKLKKIGIVHEWYENTCAVSFMVTSLILLFGAISPERSDLGMVSVAITYFIFLIVVLYVLIDAIKTSCKEKESKSIIEGSKDE
jgi:hypothetical protein